MSIAVGGSKLKINLNDGSVKFSGGGGGGLWKGGLQRGG